MAVVVNSSKMLFQVRQLGSKREVNCSKLLFVNCVQVSFHLDFAYVFSDGVEIKMFSG